MKFQLRINGKMLLYILGITIVVYVMALSYVAFKLRINSYQNAHQIFQAKAIESSNNAQKKLNSYMQTVSVLGQTFSGYEAFPEQNRRALFSEMLHTLLQKNPDYLSVWSIWGPNQLDNLDSEYQSVSEEQSPGNFHCIYLRQGDSLIRKPYDKTDSLEILIQQVYAEVKNTLEPVVLEPYFALPRGENKRPVLQSKMAVPILKDEDFKGVAGIDVPLSYVQQAFSNLKPMGTGKVFIITHEGKFLSHPEADYLGKSFKEYAPEMESTFTVSKLIERGQENEFESIEPLSGESCIFRIEPIHIGSTTTPWAICTAVPLDTIYQSANKTFRLALIIGLLGLVFVSLVILGIAYSISTPIVKSTRVLQEISRGNIRNVEMVSFAINDEINDMALAMNSLVEGLNSAALFAQQIGEGYLNVNYQLLSENDALGSSLIAMQESLVIAKKAEEEKRLGDEKRNWVTHGLAKFGEVIRQHNDNMDKFTLNITKNIADYMNVAQIAIYINKQIEDEHQGADTFELKAAMAYGKIVKLNKSFEKGHELLGRCALDTNTIYLEDLPERYVQLSPGMQDKKRPNNLLIVAMHINGNTLGIIELLSYEKLEAHQIDFIEKLSENIASVVASVKTNLRTENLLEQSQHQADELAQHEEEMRQNLEEMEATQEEANKRQDALKSHLKAIKGSIMMAELDIQGRILDISAAMSIMYGATLDNMRGKYYEAFIAHDKTTQQEFAEFWQTLTQAGEGKRKQKTVQRNKEYWMLESYKVVEREGLNPRVIVVATDVTKEKELNDMLQAKLKS